MTANQINYAKHREESRHNLVGETQRTEELRHLGTQAAAAMSQARTAASRASEEARANAEKERVNWFSAKESARHNLTTEGAEASKLAESIRHSKQLEYLQQRDVERSEAATQSQIRLQDIQGVAQMRNASAAEQNARAALQSALARQIQANASLQQITELQRHNIASEQLGIANLQELIRHQQAVEAETQRHNVSGETVNRWQAKSQSEVAKAQTSQASTASRRADYEQARTVGQVTKDFTGAAKDIANLFGGVIYGA